MSQRGCADQHLAKVLKDAPVTPLVCVSKCGTGDITPEADMIELFFVRVQTSINISQAISTGHLGICQTKELVEGGEFLYPVFSPIPTNADIKLMSRKILE